MAVNKGLTEVNERHAQVRERPRGRSQACAGKGTTAWSVRLSLLSGGRCESPVWLCRKIFLFHVSSSTPSGCDQDWMGQGWSLNERVWLHLRGKIPWRGPVLVPMGQEWPMLRGVLVKAGLVYSWHR